MGLRPLAFWEYRRLSLRDYMDFLRGSRWETYKPARSRPKQGRQGGRLRVASGATAPGPTLEGAPRFRPMSLSSYIPGKLEMLIHAPFKILLQGQIP